MSNRASDFLRQDLFKVLQAIRFTVILQSHFDTSCVNTNQSHFNTHVELFDAHVKSI